MSDTPQTLEALCHLDLLDGFALKSDRKVVALRLRPGTYADEQYARKVAAELHRTPNGFELVERQLTYDDTIACAQIEALLDDKGEPFNVALTPAALGKLTELDHQRLRDRLAMIYVFVRQQHGLIDKPDAEQDAASEIPHTQLLRQVKTRLLTAGFSDVAVDAMTLPEILGHLEDLADQAKAQADALKP